jgi:hypothetical protein
MSKSDASEKKRIGGSDAEKQWAEQVDALRAEADRYRHAQRQIVEAFGVLWNAQLDLSIAEGNASSIRRVLTRPVEFYDNCDCSVSSDGGGDGSGSKTG